VDAGVTMESDRNVTDLEAIPGRLAQQLSREVDETEAIRRESHLASKAPR
jgi:hypothetical protein